MGKHLSWRESSLLHDWRVSQRPSGTHKSIWVLSSASGRNGQGGGRELVFRANEADSTTVFPVEKRIRLVSFLYAPPDQERDERSQSNTANDDSSQCTVAESEE